MFFPPLSDVNPFGALFPQVLESSVWPPVPNPILESQVMQSRWSFPRIPILALAETLWLAAALKPSRLQPVCKDAYEPISDFHLSRPKEVAWKTPPASAESWLSCQPERTLPAGQFSCRDRPLWRVWPNRKATWSLPCQSQFFPLQRCMCLCRSPEKNHSGMSSEI